MKTTKKKMMRSLKTPSMVNVSDTTLWLVTTCKCIFFIFDISFFRYADSNDDSEDEGIKEY